MRLAVVGGPPSCGKTAVLLHALGRLRSEGHEVRVAKLDCLATGDAEEYRRRGFGAVVGLSTYVCPDHYLATNIDRIVAWGAREGADLLVVESAGLCSRCAPYLEGCLAVAVVDVLSGVNAPRKTGPLLRAADAVVLTRGDLVSQAERDVFRLRVSQLNRRARLLEINGLSGQGSRALSALLGSAPEVAPEAELHLRFAMPAAVCSFCLGEKRAGVAQAAGNVRLMDLGDPDEPAGEDEA